MKIKMKNLSKRYKEKKVKCIFCNDTGLAQTDDGTGNKWCDMCTICGNI